MFHAALHPLAAVRSHAASMVLATLKHCSEPARQRFLGAAADACGRLKDEKQAQHLSNLCAQLLLDSVLHRNSVTHFVSPAEPEM